MEKKNPNVSIGVTYGVIIGLIYVILLFWRWSSAEKIIQFGIIAVVNYVIVLCIMFYEAYTRRKANGGYIELKHVFQTLFISVLIFEFMYALYNYIHLAYIDPNVVDRMKAGMQEMLDKAGDNMKDEDKEKALSRFDQIKDATKIGQVIKSYLTSIAISGVFALLISLIMKKKKPAFEEVN